MDNLIYIWIVNRILDFFGGITPICLGSAAIALMFYLFFRTGGCCELGKDGKEKIEHCARCCKRWIIWSIILSFFCGLFGKFTLNKTEFKTVAVYLIGKEIVQSERGDKIINVIDTKLDEWIKKIEK